MLLEQKASFQDIKKRDTIKFGFYEQDADLSNGKEEIEWIVLSVEENKAPVISKNALDCHQYNSTFTFVTWENCELRQWLNDDFLNTAFGKNSKEIIPSISIKADPNPDYNTDSGNDTNDKIFLLSIMEVEKYLASNSAIGSRPTRYAFSNGGYVNSGDVHCWWWLRTPWLY